MTDSFTFRVDGPPVPKLRPRVTSRGTYMPRRYLRYRDTVSAAAMGERPEGWSTEGTFSVRIKCAFGVVTSGARKGMDKLRCGDIDNVAGTALDALNGIAWADDQQVCGLHIERVMGDVDPYLEVRVRRL